MHRDPADPIIHWQRCASDGLECPQEAFTQVFHEEANNPDFAAIVRAVDWGRVRWELAEYSGIALRQVRVDRGYQHALDRAAIGPPNSASPMNERRWSRIGKRRIPGSPRR
jgi:hypothetical protein